MSAPSTTREQTGCFDLLLNRLRVRRLIQDSNQSRHGTFRLLDISVNFRDEAGVVGITHYVQLCRRISNFGSGVGHCLTGVRDLWSVSSLLPLNMLGRSDLGLEAVMLSWPGASASVPLLPRSVASTSGVRALSSVSLVIGTLRRLQCFPELSFTVKPSVSLRHWCHCEVGLPEEHVPTVASSSRIQSS